jgi:thymidine phosphorylase
MLALGGIAADAAEGAARIDAAIRDGRAAERFAAMVAALGGPSDLLERPQVHLPRAGVIRPVLPERAGIVTAIDTRAIGVAVIGLGGGRTRPQDDIDHAVGFTDLAGLGVGVGPERPLGTVHARDEASAEAAARALAAACAIGADAPLPHSPVTERIGLTT